MSPAAGPDDVPFGVLHALVVKGMTQPGPLAASAGLDDGAVTAALGRLLAAGLASHQEVRGLWRVTAAGSAQHGRLLDMDLPAAARDRLRPAYQRFLPLNSQFKGICARWQLRGAVPNDHRDPGYDQGRIAELGALHPEAAAVITDLAAVRDRFGRYGERLTAALARIRDGDPKAFTGVLRESYHDIWMELHRDLLLSLQISRETEQPGEAGETGGAAGQPARAAR